MRKFFSGFKEGFKEFGHNIQIIVNLFLFSFVYFFGVGITSIIAKISKKEFLEKDLGKESYWSELNLKKEGKEKYYRQF